MASEVGVTQTLPWFHTGAIDTPRVRDALVAVLPLPSIQTPEAYTYTKGFINRLKTFWIGQGQTLLLVLSGEELVWTRHQTGWLSHNKNRWN